MDHVNNHARNEKEEIHHAEDEKGSQRKTIPQWTDDTAQGGGGGGGAKGFILSDCECRTAFLFSGGTAGLLT